MHSRSSAPGNLRLVFIVAILIGYGCAPTSHPEEQQHHYNLKDRILRLHDKGAVISSGFDRASEMAVFITNNYSVQLRGDDLYINDLYYGSTAPGDTIRVHSGSVNINNTERMGLFLTRQQRAMLYPETHIGYYLHGQLMLVVFSHGSMVGIQSSPWARDLLRFNHLRIDVSGGQLRVNRDVLEILTAADVIYVDDYGIYILRDALTGNTSAKDLGNLAIAGTNVVRVWPTRAQVLLKEPFWRGSIILPVGAFLENGILPQSDSREP